MSVSPDMVVRCAAGTESSRLGAELVVLDASGTMLRGFNATAARVWELADGRRSLGQIASRIAGEYAAPASRVLEDVMQFARALIERRLVEAVTSPEAAASKGAP